MIIRTSAPKRPMYQSRPYKPSPARREAIYGRIQSMDPPRRKPIRALLRKVLRAVTR